MILHSSDYMEKELPSAAAFKEEWRRIALRV
jgi:hypothetical protein